MQSNDINREVPHNELDLPVFKPEILSGKTRPWRVLLLLGGIIFFLWAIMAPSMFRSRMAANEAAAQGACKTIAAAQFDYANDSKHHFATSLKRLNSGEGAGERMYLDSSLGKGLKNGYTYHLEVGPPRTEDGITSYWAWSAAAWPVAYKTTGVRSFYVDESGVLRAQDLDGTRGTIQMRSID